MAAHVCLYHECAYYYINAYNISKVEKKVSCNGGSDVNHNGSNKQYTTNVQSKKKRRIFSKFEYNELHELRRRRKGLKIKTYFFFDFVCSYILNAWKYSAMYQGRGQAFNWKGRKVKQNFLKKSKKQFEPPAPCISLRFYPSSGMKEINKIKRN